MGKQVEKQKTPVSEIEMAKAMINGWRQVVGGEPNKKQIAILLAHNSLETGHRNSMWNYNLGNITTKASSEYNWFTLTTKEQMKPGQWETMTMKYRAYPTLQDGVNDYLKFLSKNPRYAQAWQQVLNSDPAAFSKQLKASGYYTANEGPYTDAISKLFNTYTTRKLKGEVSSNKAEEKNKTVDSVTTTGNKPADSGTTLNNNEIKLNDVLKEINQINKEKLPSKEEIGSSNKTELLNFLKDLDVDVSGELEQASEQELEGFLNELIGKFASKNSKHLPTNNILIKFNQINPIYSIECANILSNVLDTELLSESSIHINGNEVDLQCNIRGPKLLCRYAVESLSEDVINSFNQVLNKIKINPLNVNFLVDKKSSYKEVGFESLNSNHRKFLFKFAYRNK